LYYILKNNILSDFESTLSEPKGFPREVNFISGKVISEKIKTPLVFTTNAKQGDAMVDFSKGSVTLMSKRFLEILQGAGVDNLQVFPAIVKSEEDETVWKDYFAVNVLGMISCADLSKSTYDEIMPGHYAFDELAIYPEKAKGTLLFRLHEHSPTIIMHRSVGVHIKSQDPDKTLLGWTVERIIQ
jgi:hypothetical protein